MYKSPELLTERRVYEGIGVQLTKALSVDMKAKSFVMPSLVSVKFHPFCSRC